MIRHTKTVQKGLLLVLLASAAIVGCELLVDFDRTKIPVEVTETGPADSSLPDTSTFDTGTDAPGVDAADGSDAPDG